MTERRRLAALGMAGLILGLLLVGCAHEQAYKRGTKFSSQGQYDLAVAELEEAVALAEKAGKDKVVRKYRAKLAAVKKEAAWYHYNRAENLFAQTDLGEALTLAERCVTYDPAQQKYTAFRQRVRDAIAEAEQRRKQALTLADDGQWDAALQQMEQALQQYRSLPGGDGDRQQIRQRAYQHYLDRAEARLRENDLVGARTEARQALVYQANGREANAIVETVRNREEAAELIARGRALLAQSRNQQALDLFEQAEELHPTHAELPTLLNQARRAVCDATIGRGKQAMEAGHYAAALQAFIESNDLLGGYGGVNALMADARARLGQGHVQQAERDVQNEQAGAVVAHALAALGYESDNAEARRLLGQALEQVRQRVRYTIAFLGFRAAPAQRATADSLTAVTLEYVTRTRPANVVLVERPDLQTVIEQGQTEVPIAIAEDPEAVDALLVGEVMESQIVTQTQQVGEGESTYQDGYRPEPNPDYVKAAAEADAALKDLEKARRQLEDAEARFARYEDARPEDGRAWRRRLQAEADIIKAREHLVDAATRVHTTRIIVDGIPAELMVPNMVKHVFPIEEVTWTATVRCLVKMLDAVTGEVILAKQVDAQYAKSDRMVPVDPAHNVPEDPLELPDDRVLLEGAAQAAMDKLKPALNDILARHGLRFATALQQAEAAGQMEEALNNAIKYLFAYPRGAEKTKAMLDYVHRYLGDEDSLLDIRELLRVHGQIPLK